MTWNRDHRHGERSLPLLVSNPLLFEIFIMKRLLLAVPLLFLAACGPDIPENFAAPAIERERLADALDADCQQERAGYWFCTAENGFFHVFTEESEHAGTLVRQVMLDRNSEDRLMVDAAELYGFSAEQVKAVTSGQSPRAVAGNFVLHLDDIWNEPVIELNTSGMVTAQN